MKVLYLTNKPIYPSVDGGTVAMGNMLECLIRQEIEVKHLFLSTQKHPSSPKEYPEYLRNAILPEGAYVNTKVTVWGAFKYLFKKGSYNIERFRSSQMKELIVSTLRDGRYDCVLLDSLYVALYAETIRSNYKGKIYLRAHNVEHQIWSDLAVNTRTLIKKLYLHKLAQDLKEYEFTVLNKMDGILTLSEKDTEALKNWNVSVPIKTIPVAIPVASDVSSFSKKNSFFHLGSMNWKPNMEAVERLLRIFPEIKKKLPDAELYIAGSNNQEMKKTINENGIYYDGYIENLSEYCRNKGILVSPILSGSGIRIKILEMMALGIPVITTDIGAQGIEHENSGCIRIANTDSELIQACLELAQDSSKRSQIGSRGMHYIRNKHNIDTISKEIIEFIRNK